MNNEKVYKVTKIKVTKENTDRFVRENDTLNGTVFCEVGKCMMVEGRNMTNFLRTSPVENIEEVKDGNFLVKTANSVYSLELQEQ